MDALKGSQERHFRNRVAFFFGAPGMARSALTGAVPATVVVAG